jgi:uncharacterized protein (TIGR00251 family)
VTVRLSEGPKGTTFDVRVVPNSPRCALSVNEDGSLRARIDAPPVDGEANDRLLRFLAKEVLGVPRSALKLVAGERGRNKTVAVDRPLADVRAALDRFLIDSSR